MCSIPTRRVDLTREVDLIEEVARVYGYDRIEEKKSAFVDFSRRGKLETTADHGADRRRSGRGSGRRSPIPWWTRSGPRWRGLPAVDHPQPARTGHGATSAPAWFRDFSTPWRTISAMAPETSNSSKSGIFSRDSGLPAKTLVEGYQEEERLRPAHHGTGVAEAVGDATARVGPL